MALPSPGMILPLAFIKDFPAYMPLLVYTEQAPRNPFDSASAPEVPVDALTSDLHAITIPGSLVTEEIREKMNSAMEAEKQDFAPSAPLVEREDDEGELALVAPG